MRLLYFYLKGCPYCRRADGIIERLISAEPEYSRVSVTKIEERDNAALADTFDYFYVPCLFATDADDATDADGVDPSKCVKLHEGDPTEAAIKKAFDYCLDAEKAAK